MKYEKFDFAALINYEPKTKVVLTRLNEPNIDRMAKAFHDLLRK